MNKIILTALFTFFCLFSSQFTLANYAVPDSLGIKTIEGKKFIVHKVEPKETLYAIGRRYQVSVDEIIASNEEVKDGYAIDQIGRILFIPLKTAVNSVKIETPVKKHMVKSGETLYGLSREYNVSVSDLKKWNQLQSDQLALGQVLIVSAEGSKSKTNADQTGKLGEESVGKPKSKITHQVEAGETIYGISKKYQVTQDEIKNWNNLSSNEIAIGQELVVGYKTDTSKDKVEDNGGQMMDVAVQRFHIAKKGETYADVADDYNLYLPDLENWNNFEEPFVGGEVIKIVPPSMNSEPVKKGSADTQVKKSDSIQKGNVHIVQSGETIYSLSDAYQVDMEDLRKWNELDNYQLSVGQKLYVKNPDAFEVDDKYKDSVKEEKQQEPVVDIVKVADKAPVQDTKAYFTVEEEDIPKIEKVVEKGVAEVIEGSDNTEKYLALHRTAKIGTIMQVRNDLNDQIVFVRVLGKLPNTGVDQKVIIRISKKAFQKLGGVDYKFPVEISYLPLDD